MPNILMENLLSYARQSEENKQIVLKIDSAWDVFKIRPKIDAGGCSLMQASFAIRKVQNELKTQVI